MSRERKELAEVAKICELRLEQARDERAAAEQAVHIAQVQLRLLDLSIVSGLALCEAAAKALAAESDRVMLLKKTGKA